MVAAIPSPGYQGSSVIFTDERDHMIDSLNPRFTSTTPFGEPQEAPPHGGASSVCAG